MNKTPILTTSLLADLPGLSIYPLSIIQDKDRYYFLAKETDGVSKVFGLAGAPPADDFETRSQIAENVWLAPLSPSNAVALRARLAWLNPCQLDLSPSFGFGDRLGLATPGHIMAARSEGVDSAPRIAPVFAQQSVRENSRTGRSPQDVLDDAMWGVFQESWQTVWGADADHIKNSAELPSFINAGYTFFTFDPGEHVDGAADSDSLVTLRAKMKELPWDALDSSVEIMTHSYLVSPSDIGEQELVFDKEILLRAVAKYGRAIAHTASLYRDLVALAGDRAIDVEISVDETDTPTTVHEHYFFANELRRLGVRWVSLAPRFVGLFAKGIDYIGDRQAFDTAVNGHAAVARALGPYKLSLHSGSDKFSIYPLARQATKGLLHIKTAGTSYLEGLRVLANQEPGFFRQILALSQARFEHDKKSYILSVEKERIKSVDALTDSALAAQLDDPNTRQVLHVTYGSVLDKFGDELKSWLGEHEAAHDAGLLQHFRRHLT